MSSRFWDAGKFQYHQAAEEYVSSYPLIYVDNMGFYEFDSYWKQISENALDSRIHHLLSQDSTQRRVNEIRENIKLTQFVTDSDFVQNRNKLTLLNGTIDISDWSCPVFNQDEFCKEDYSTIQLAVNYNSAAECPRFMKFLNEVFKEDADTIATVQEMFGYCLTTSTKFEKAFLLYGDGANGKSVLINVLSNLLTAENITTLSISNFKKQFDRSKLVNKLVNISTEFEEAILQSEDLKKIISGEWIDVCYKFKQAFDYRPFCKIITSTNNIPYIRDRSNGIFRRLITIPFEVTFEEGDQDRELIDKLKLEMDGIFNFALEGLKRLQDQKKFTEGSKTERLKRHIQYASNRVLEFVEEYVEFNTDLEISSKELYEAYSTFCSEM